MDKRRISVNVQNQILILRDKNYGIRRISKSLNIARNTVRDFLRAYDGSTEKETTDSVSEIQGATDSDSKINWNEVHLNFNKGVPIKTQWHELCFNSDISYSSFYHQYRRRYKPQPVVTMRLIHNPGEKVFFDFADGISITSRTNGEKTKTQLFVGVMPFSGLTKGEFLLDQKQLSMLPAVENIFHQIGGVPKYAVFDNLKSAVNKAHIYDPDTNQSMIEFANHWGFAVIPARPYKPRDKAAVEAGIGVIQRQFFQEVRDSTFFSLGELNSRFKEFLEKLNQSPMKDHGGVSRMDRFTSERSILQTVMATNFELSVWKTCKVHPDCHVQVENRFYSVQHQYVGLTVKVRIRKNTIEIFSSDGENLCLHIKLKGNDRASTIEAHYPEEKLATSRFEVRHAIKQSESIGPKTNEFIIKLFAQEYPLRFLRRAQGILRLVQSGHVRKEDLEYACGQGLLFNRTHFGYIKSAAMFHRSGGGKLCSVAPIRDLNQSYLRNQSTE
jgi:transposase